jgi:hypothetical protein
LISWSKSKNQMLDLSQAMEMVEELNLDSHTHSGITSLGGYGEDIAVLLYEECRHIQAINQGLVEYMKNDLRDYVNDALNHHINEHGLNYRNEQIVYFNKELEKLDAMIQRNADPK